MNAITEINKHFDAAAERARLQACADQHRADNLPRPESICARDARIDESDDDYPDDNDILDIMLENFGLGAVDAIERLGKFDFDAARAKVEQAA